MAEVPTPDRCGTISLSQQTQWPGPPYRLPDAYLLPLPTARIWNASDHELPKVIGEERGGFVGGSLGAGAGVAGSYAGGKIADGLTIPTRAPLRTRSAR